MGWVVIVGRMTSPRFTTEHPLAAPAPMASFDPERTVLLRDRPIATGGQDVHAAPRQSWAPSATDPRPAPSWQYPGTPPRALGSAPGWPPSAAPSEWGYPPHNAFQHAPAAGPGRRKVLPLVLAAAVLLIVVVVIATIGKDGALTAFSADSKVSEPSSAPSATSPSTSTSSAPSSTAPTTPTPTPTAPQPPVPATAVDGLLLSGNEILAATGWPAPRAPVRPGKKGNYVLVNFENDRCHSAVEPGSQDTYRDTAYTALRAQYTHGESTPHSRYSDPEDWLFLNVAAPFPAAADATKTIESTKKSWQSCANTTTRIHTTGSDGTISRIENWALGSLSADDGVLFMQMTQVGADGWGCWRVLGARNNIAIDIAACSVGATKAAAQGAYNAIAAKVDAAA